MRKGRPSKLRVKKRHARKRGATNRGAKRPAQLAASVGRRRVRRRKR